jgi:hypothetical protein
VTTQAGQISSLLAAVIRDVDAVGKNRRNEQQRYAFRGIDDFSNALHPVLAKHGVVLRPYVVEARELEATETKSGGVMFRVSLTMDLGFVAPDGSAHVVRTVGEGCDTGDKATNKAMSAALKYALLMTFLIPTEDRELADSETDSHEARRPAREQQRQAQVVQAAAKVLDAKPVAAPNPAALVAVRKKLSALLEKTPAAWRDQVNADIGDADADVAKLEGIASELARALSEKP